MDDSALRSLFHQHVWQPFTQMKLAGEPHFIERGKGALLVTRDGQEIVDAIGSWWVNIHGHSHPKINAAIANQAEALEHVIFAGLSHAPGVELAARLSATTNHHLPRVYYSDNGSTAIEIALKMAYQFFQNKGAVHKREFISLTGAYHGDTIGTMSVGARSVFHEMYADLLFDTHYVSPPAVAFENWHIVDESHPAIQTALTELEELLSAKSTQICALLVEPLVQGASAAFAMYPPAYLRAAFQLCKEYDVFTIADEVFTGSGRTGRYYACEHAGVWPDIMALSKGLSGGYLPLAATLCSEKIYQGFYSDNRAHTLFHGHSMTGNPLGCAAALASLDLFTAENTLQRVQELEQHYRKLAAELLAGPLAAFTKEVRILGSIFALELAADLQYTSDFGWQVMQRSIAGGVLLRPLGKVIYMTPPYCISSAQLEKAFSVLHSVLLELLAD
ncbi:MAG: adenosylmethionine--8-amino-7-oxononanoate transaminase [Leptospiraceae bacterium]|nr:adenosylmethionine--8-amino-7-oxononanoate transaminase [Leptospiraceae bacterium]